MRNEPDEEVEVDVTVLPELDEELPELEEETPIISGLQNAGIQLPLEA